MNYKQVIILRGDLEMSNGKIISQACHSSLGSYRESKQKVREKWLSEGGKKVVLKVDSKKNLMDIYKRVEKKQFPCYLVKDAGLTELEKGEITSLGVGPVEEDKINPITGSLEPF